ncbi:MAG: S-adenosylmethionine:tRNA ribosyltransferase-isomerase [Agriterribacter sp.]
MHPGQLHIKDFIYPLPDERIATHPLPNRDDSKLLVYKSGSIQNDHYRNIASHIPAGSLLVFNDTKVVEARLKFQKPSGGMIEIFCLSPHAKYPDITNAMMQQGKVWWNCLVGGASKWKHGIVLEKKIELSGSTIHLKAAIIGRFPDSFLVEMSWEPSHITFAEILHSGGLLPLPPYIKRELEKNDTERYQTIYANQDGSVAAPTAGLHFTQRIFELLKAKNINTEFVTLHVGAGTFKPVKADSMQDHTMHAEFIDVEKKSIEALLRHTGDIFCVGTTALRTVESLYWMGVKVKQQPEIQLKDLIIGQWEVYDSLMQHRVPVKESLHALLRWMGSNAMQRLVTQTQILIAPGYTPAVIKGLITNFHQPQSTLLLLVAALIGDDWKKVYQYALENDYRFLSYGDGCLLFT